MSGTSLDGLDLCLCEFFYSNKKWTYQIIDAKTINYTKSFKNKLKEATTLSGLELALLNNFVGEYYAKQINRYLKNKKQKPQLIASHGQTVFHQPNKRLTLQIGNGAIIAAKTGITTVCDFRTKDVALGGQGAPLVPIGDKLLFAEFDACLNLGGFANITINKKKQLVAFDICAVNIVLNTLCETIGKSYDKNGLIASKNKLNNDLISELNKINYYKLLPPKSLGKEWVEKTIHPILLKYSIATEELIASYTEHAALQLASVINKYKLKKVLVTGGGAFNSYLVKRVQQLSYAKLIVPENNTIAFKEALIFAFLGVLRVLDKNNTLKQVTGACRNSVGGAVYIGT